jgi:hypothetical protein
MWTLFNNAGWPYPIAYTTDDCTNELHSVGEVLAMTLFKILWGICMVELRKFTEVLSQDVRRPGRVSNQVPAEYVSNVIAGASVPTVSSWCSSYHCVPRHHTLFSSLWIVVYIPI